MIPDGTRGATPLLELEDVSHAYGDRPALTGLSLALAPGAIGCLLGPSGCGKTTALRIVAGFERPSRGRVRLEGAPVAGPGVHVPPERRGVGVVFQDHALFPHLTVADNVGFGLRGLRAPERRRRVLELLAAVGLEAEGGRHPHELSGGQQQRVALARALAPHPRLLLLDEPFSSLDVELRERLCVEVRALLKRAGATAVLVTHDQREAFAMADEIGVMSGGRLVQWGTGPDLYHRPASRFVADFVGEGAFLAGTAAAGGVATPLGLVAVPLPPGAGPGTSVTLLVRPEAVLLDPAGPARAQVEGATFRGAHALAALRLEAGGRLLALVPGEGGVRAGDRAGVRLDPRHVVALPPDPPSP